MIRQCSRRGFFSSVVALAAGSTIAVVRQHIYAQEPAPFRHIGMLQGGSWSEEWVKAFREGLRDAGYVEGRDIVMEWRPADGNYDRVPQLAADLVQRKVEVIVADGTIPTRAAKRATATVPIVMVSVADPVGSGLVANLAHPGGNVTGLSMMTSELSPKRLHLIKEAIPRLTRVAVLWNPATPYHPKIVEELKAAAPSLSIKLTFMGVETPEDVNPAFSTVRRARSQALYVIEDALFFTHRKKLMKLCIDGPTTNHLRTKGVC